jgi:hypothetical protein
VKNVNLNINKINKNYGISNVFNALLNIILIQTHKNVKFVMEK